jgi:hypothetical protein
MINWRRLALYAGVTVLGVSAFWLATSRGAPDTGRVLGRETHADGSRSVVLLSQPYRLDKMYMSMTGPHGNQPGVRLADDAADDETVYVTAVRTDVVDHRTHAPVSNEFFCHSNLTLNPETTNPDAHNAAFSPATHADWRFFTLVPGRMDVRLPDGFGLPVKSGTRLDYYTMAINQNPGQPDRTIRMKTDIRYRRASADRPVRPLFRRALYVYQQHKPEASATAQFLAGHQGEHCGEACKFDARGQTPSLFIPLAAGGKRDQHPGFSCCVENASPEGVEPQFGDENTVHWMVPPGRHQYRSEVTRQVDLPHDTAAHYVTGHLHPFGEWMRLIDMETGKVVMEVTAEHFTDRLGVKAMSETTSREGIPLVKGRRYELVTQYNNTLDKPIDAMAILYAYLAE